jgi:4-amino-4-deoxy-L-arabinose transferase-like glycosyltransferase
LLLSIIALFYWWGTGNIALFDWDEINFAEISREMLLVDNYWQPTINFLPFHEKPPLYNWLQILSFQTFGINEMAARLPNVICGVLTLASLAYIGRRWRSRAFGYWWAAFMAFSLLPQLYFRSGIIDPWFNLFIFLALAILLTQKNGLPSFGEMLAAGVLLGLSVLTKGPVGALLAGLVLLIDLIRRRSEAMELWWRYACVGLVSILPMVIWIAWIWRLDDGFFAREFISYQWRLFIQEDAGHGGFPGYHFVVLLLGCFPASVFALPAIVRPRWFGTDRQFRNLLALFWVVLILFSIVSTKIVHYSSLAYFPLTYLAARVVMAKDLTLPRWSRSVNIGIWCVYALVLVALPLVAQFVLPVLDIQDVDLQSSLEQVDSRVGIYALFGLPLIGLIYQLLRYQQAKDKQASAILQLVGTTYVVIIGLLIYLGNVQQATQGANVEFFSERSNQRAYHGMAYRKSYVPLFYGRITPENGGRERDFRFHGPIERDLYFASPVRRTEQVLLEVPDSELLYQKGGFSFYRRPAGGQ